MTLGRLAGLVMLVVAGCAPAAVRVIPGAAEGSRLPAVDSRPLVDPTAGASSTDSVSLPAVHPGKERASVLPVPVALRFDFDRTDHGFVVEDDGAFGSVSWNPDRGRIEVLADRRVGKYERMAKVLPFPLTPRGSFTVSSRFGMIERGNAQDVFGLMLMGGETLSPTTNFMSARFYERDGHLGEEPELSLSFYDERQRRRLEERTRLGWGLVYRLEIRYDASTRRLEMSIRGDGGALLEWGAYVVGSHADDGFRFDRVGVGIARIAGPQEAPSRVWVDDIAVDASPPG